MKELLYPTILMGLALSATAHDDALTGKPHDGAAVTHAVRTGSGIEMYESVPNWCQLPPGQTEIGNTHGAIVVDRAGNIYINSDTKRSIMVYTPDGQFVRSFGEDFVAIHGMALHQEGGEEFIYAAHLGGAQAVKFKLDGTVLWTIGWPQESGLYKDKNEYKPTAIAVAPNGDVFVSDGYGKSLIHQYSADRKYIRSFGGKGTEPGKFQTSHGMALDTRGPKPLLLICDRENRRLQHFDLDGNFVAVTTTGLRRPCSISIRGDKVAVAELEGRVTILDKNNHPIAFLGDNPVKAQWANNPVPPTDWRDGIFTAPHGVCYDAAGNLYVMDWNKSGRISRLNRVYPE